MAVAVERQRLLARTRRVYKVRLETGMKPLKSCCNGDGRPVKPPSFVLCAECFAALDKQMNDLLKPRAPIPVQGTAPAKETR